MWAMTSPRPPPRRWVTPRPLRVTASPPGCRGQVDVLDAVEGLERQGRPEGGRRHRDADRRVQVVTAAGERLVRLDPDLDIEVAVRAAGRADLTLAAQLDAGAGVDAGGDADLHRPALADPAVAGAVVARVGDAVAESQAMHGRVVATWPRSCAGPRVSPRPPHRSQVRRRCRLGARPSHAADDGGVDEQVRLPPKTAVSGISPRTRRRRRAAGGRGPRPPRRRHPGEEGVHDVAEREAESGRPEYRGLKNERRFSGSEHVIGLGDLLELLLGLRPRVDVGVQPAGGLAVGALDVLGGRVPRNTEIGVVVVQGSPSTSALGVRL